MAWVYVCIGTLIVVGIGVAIWVAGNGYLIGKPTEPTPAPEAIAPLPPEPPPIQPITLSDIHVSVIRIGDIDITAILAWENRLPGTPFHLWVSVEDGNLVLHSPDNEPRTVEILRNQKLSLFGSTLYHEASDNRLAIDLQVDGGSTNE